MTGIVRHSETVHSDAVAIGIHVHGGGKPLVLLPSYGRDGGADYDDITSRACGGGLARASAAAARNRRLLGSDDRSIFPWSGRRGGPLGTRTIG